MPSRTAMHALRALRARGAVSGQGNEDWEATQGLRIDFSDPR